jgi:hypothetical protein
MEHRNEMESRIVRIRVRWGGASDAISRGLLKQADSSLLLCTVAGQKQVKPFSRRRTPIAEFTFDQVPDSATHVGFWWYAADFNINPMRPRAREHYSWALQGTAYVPLLTSQLETSPRVELTQFLSIDPDCELVVLTVDLLELNVSPPVPSTTFEPSLCLKRYEEKISKELYTRRQQQNPVAIDHLGTWQDTAILIPSPSKAHHIPVPMWVFVWPAYLHRRLAPPRILRRYLDIARLRLQNNTSTTNSKEAASMQLVCEAASLYALSCEYRPDHSGKQEIEQFTWLSHQPSSISHNGIDCEDAAEHCLRVLLALQADPECEMAELLSEYEFMFCIVTLDVSGHLQYHAVVMGFDKQWLHALRDSSSSPPPPPPRHRPVLIEGTDYIVSHYDFHESKSPQADTRRFFNNPLSLKPQFRTRVPSLALQESKQYHHLVLALTPQWIETHSIGEVSFLDEKGALGVPLTELLCGDPKVTVGIRMQVPKTRVTSEMLEYAAYCLSFLPPFEQLPYATADHTELPRGTVSWTTHKAACDGAMSALEEQHPKLRCETVTEQIGQNSMYGIVIVHGD